MHIVVCIKQVPDSAQIRVHPVTNTIMRQGVPTIVNPYDLVSLEEALRLKDRLGATVTAISMGPPMAETALRKCLGYGADRAVLLTDRMFAGSDTLATSYVLSTAIERLHEQEPVDIIFAGKQTIDGDTAQVGPGIARRLGVQQLTYVSALTGLDLDSREIVVERRSEGGVQVLSSRLPCLITMLEGTCRIRYADMDSLFRAARAEVEVWSAQAAGITDKTQCGLKGSPTMVRRVFAPSPRTERAKILGAEAVDADSAVAEALDTLLAEQPALAAELAPPA